MFRRWYLREFGDDDEMGDSGIHLATDLREQLDLDQLAWVHLTG